MDSHLAHRNRRRREDATPGPGDTESSGRNVSGFEVALRVASELAVVWAFGLALLLILAQRV